MRIVIHASGMPFNGDTIPNGESLGGSESAAYFVAKELTKLGHTVFMFTASEREGRFDSVIYTYHGEMSEQFPMGDRFSYAMQAPYDVIIAQRSPWAFRNQYNSKLNIWWLHDLALYRMAQQIQPHLCFIDQIFTVSEFHKKQVSEVYNIPEKIITATRNGTDYSMFEPFLGSEREPRSLVFAARPERGLKELVGENGLMTKLANCHLHVCGYKNTLSHMEGFYNYLWGRCEELPNVTNHGHLGKSQLYDLISRSQLYVYPTTFEDTSNIMVLESNGVGTPFIGCEGAALPETTKGGGAVLLPFKKSGEVNIDLFADTVVKILSDKQRWQALHEKALKKHQSWSDIALEWDALFEKLLAEKCSNKTRLHKHFEKNSDIVAAVKDKATEETIPDLHKNYYFYFNDDYEKHYERYYQYEYDRGVRYGPESLRGQPRFEHTASLIQQLKPESVLDYGCAHGHYVMNLVKIPELKNIYYLGIDINYSNIEIAKKWRDKEFGGDTGQIKFVMGDHKTIPKKVTFQSYEFKKYDVILCQELLEHVPNPREVAQKLMQHLADDGTMIISVPYGPWEAIGYKQHPGWRAHIHHLEPNDLQEIFGNQKDFKLVAIPHAQDIGHLMLTFKASGEELGFINYERKINEQSPQQTLSVCMIAYNEEHTIGRTLKTIENIADEIIVGVDYLTTDKTEEIANSFGAKVFSIPSPTEIGFDKARNKTIEKAKMDWIFWIDCDETLEAPENMLKYLRSNCLDAYAVKQHHYAVEPASLFKTDFPARLFRNNIGMKFYGFVHEHPELGLNKGPGKTWLIHDIAIMHTGYSTEAIRRKRFERNWPLMMKDHKEYPQRELGRFLWMRDLIHLVKYTLEKNNRQITPEIQQWCQEGISTYREILKSKNTRLISEGLQFYSECVLVSGNGDGIEFNLDMSSRKMGRENHLPVKELKGLFANKKDIKLFISVMQEELTRNYDNKYF